MAREPPFTFVVTGSESPAQWEHVMRAGESNFNVVESVFRDYGTQFQPTMALTRARMLRNRLQ